MTAGGALAVLVSFIVKENKDLGFALLVWELHFLTDLLFFRTFTILSKKSGSNYSDFQS